MVKGEDPRLCLPKQNAEVHRRPGLGPAVALQPALLGADAPRYRLLWAAKRWDPTTAVSASVCDRDAEEENSRKEPLFCAWSRVLVSRLGARLGRRRKQQQMAVYDRLRHVDDLPAVVLRVPAEQLEGSICVD